MAAGPKEYQECLPFARKVDLDERYLRMDIDALSGGNQQKAILARSLMKGSKYLLLYDPSRGVDVGTKSSVYDHDGRSSPRPAGPCSGTRPT